MTNKDVNSRVEFLQAIKEEFNQFQLHYKKETEESERNYNAQKTEIESKLQQMSKEHEKEKQDNSFIKDVKDETISNYKSVSNYLFGFMIVSVIILVYFFYSEGFEINIFTTFMLIAGFLSYLAGNNMGGEIQSIMKIRTPSQCIKKPPFYYTLFNKRTLIEIYEEAQKNKSNFLNSKYSKQIADCNKETQQLLNILNNAVKSEKLAFDNKNKTKLTAYKNELNTIVGELNNIHQLSSQSKNFIDQENRFIFSSSNYSLNYIFTFEEIIGVNNDTFNIPNFEKFGATGNLYIDAKKQDKQITASIVTDIIFKQLFGIRPSKLKLVLFDPIELGAFFSSFHSLHKEVTSGIIYTNEDDLNEILDSTLRHINMVIQKLLQNIYADLNDYNIQNSEMSEPYKLIVLNDFPSAFDEQKLKKLNQILISGSKCGVYVILVGHLNLRSWNECVINEILTDNYRAVFDQIESNSLISMFNKEIEKAGDIVVSIEQILTKQEGWWSSDSSTSIQLPLGKRGKEIQELKFDNKDDNQALMIGKPGSGKSNLLHVIIISAITKYGPDELEIYLIDFKGGVEFSVYAEFEIPHLRTVALESDREFGLSVIDGVEKELLLREKLFSAAGVQNIEQYNKKFADKKVPRILFIVDEFQEFFNINDEINDEVSLKYDRIIRKGRAFGINSLFSSQTLDGKSIPISTKELIDIRIALMCGDNDVREIMDSSNLSAKDLSRPGEAIYNAENGKSVGNQRFQAVFIERDKIVDIVKNVAEHNSAKPYTKKERFIFRGDQLAFINKTNHPLQSEDLTKYKSIRFWLGEPISMSKDLYSDFKFSSSQNLLIIGEDVEGARIFSNLIHCVFRQSEKLQTIYICNPLSDVDDCFSDYNIAYGQTSGNLVFNPSKLDLMIDELYAIMIERKEKEIQNKSIIVFLNSIQKIKSLREYPNDLVDKLNELLEDGPENGIFFIIHCDSINSIKRTDLKIQGFNHRIGFSMNSESYDELFGNNRINPLKNNRALYYNDEIGSVSIFKPYQLNNNQS